MVGRAGGVTCALPHGHVAWLSWVALSAPGIFVESALQSTRADEEKEVRQQLQELFSQLGSALGSAQGVMGKHEMMRNGWVMMGHDGS